MLVLGSIIAGIAAASTTIGGAGLGVGLGAVGLGAASIGTKAMIGTGVKAAGGKLATMGAGSIVKTTVATKGTVSTATAVIMKEIEEVTTKVVEEIPYIGETIAKINTSVGQAAGKAAAKHGASETTASIISSTVTTTGNVGSMKTGAKAADKINEFVYGEGENSED